MKICFAGSPPLVIARGGFSGLYVDSSSHAYRAAIGNSVPDLVLWCDIQLSKDEADICFPSILLNSASNVNEVFASRDNSYIVNGVKEAGYFPIDFTFNELTHLALKQRMYSPPYNYDALSSRVDKVEDLYMSIKPSVFWLNVEHDSFYRQHNFSMRNFVINASKTVNISHISSPEIKFLKRLKRSFASTKTKLVFRFLEQRLTEQSTNKTYGTLLKKLQFIRSFASGILVPKFYIWPTDESSYLLPHTSLVADAHAIGLQVFASDFANDNVIAHNYSFNPVDEYLSFIDNGNFSVDGVLSDFPRTPSAARECFAHLSSSASVQEKRQPLVISQCGASGDYAGCTDLSYIKAISDGADVIDCPVQMSKDGVPFCLDSVNLSTSTLVFQSHFRNLSTVIEDIQSDSGIFSFLLNWADIQALTPMMSSPYDHPQSKTFGNPKFRNAGKVISLSEFLDLAKNSSSLTGVLIKIQNARYLAANRSMNITKAVMDNLDKAGFGDRKAKRVMIQSTSIAVLKALQGRRYELVFEVQETISGAPKDTVAEFKTVVDSVVVNKASVYPNNSRFSYSSTDVVSNFQSYKLPVYVQGFRNEYESMAYDFQSDPIVEINSYAMEAGIDGFITAFPQTVVAYRKNICLGMNKTPRYMTPVLPGRLFLEFPEEAYPTTADTYHPLLNNSALLEPPLPSADRHPSSSSSSSAATPTNVAWLSCLILIYCLVCQMEIMWLVSCFSMHNSKI
ncbi:hypothetical protein KSS87_011873 [Heliosperma pusillum]|nr:hypothetical protein KSS87_011873 [Heliosperma pusillum]